MNEVVRSSLLSFSARATLHFLGFLTIVFLSRLLDAYGWGVFSFIYGFVSIGLLLGDVGFSVATIYYSSKKNTGSIISMILVLRSILLIIVFGSLCVLFWFMFPEFFEYMFVASVFGFFFGLWYYVVHVCVGKRLFEYHLLFTGLYYSLRFVLSVVFVLLGYFVFGVFIGYLFSAMIACIVGFVFIKRFLKRPVFCKIYEVVKYGLSAGVGNVSSMVFLVSDVILIGLLLSTTHVGYYNIAQKMVVFVIGLVVSLFSVLFPYFSSWEDKTKVRKYFMRAFHYSFYITVPLCFLLVFESADLVLFLFGSQYLPSVIPIFLLSFLVVDSPLFTLFYNIYASKGEPLRFTRLLLIASFMNLCLNLFTIPLLGLFGAAFSTVISRIFVLVAGVATLKKDFGFIPRLSIVKPIVFSFVASLFFVALHDVFSGISGAFAAGLVFVFIYIIFLYRFGDKEFWRVIESVLGGVLWKS